MHILIVAATNIEINPFLTFLEKNNSDINLNGKKLKDTIVSTLISGVGSIQTAAHLSLFLSKNKVDFIINAGVAGSFSSLMKPGTVVEVIQDRFGDVGAEERDGSFLDIFELQLEDQNKFPFENGWIIQESHFLLGHLPKVSAITVNMVSGTEYSINRFIKKYSPDIETMEGCAISYVAKLWNIPAIQIRSISNFVEPRDKEKWELKKAIYNLNEVLIQFFLKI